MEGDQKAGKKWLLGMGVLLIVLVLAVMIVFLPNGSADEGKPLAGKEQNPDPVVTEQTKDDVGAWEEGSIFHNNHEVRIKCPEAGHPDPESDWRTSYSDEEREWDLDIAFCFVDEMPQNETDSMSADTLWGHNVSYYVENAADDKDMIDESLTAFMTVDTDTFLRVEIKNLHSSLTDAEELLHNDDFQESFFVEIVN
ncbi:MAG: hypothetical protein ACI4AA_05550 [Lachnospiraceae bacterium]